MLTVDYYDVLQGWADLCNLDRDNLSTAEQAIARNLISKRLGLAWVNQFWPDLTRMEKRYFRAFYDNTATYAWGAEVYLPRTVKYYQALKALGPGEPPVNSSGVASPNWTEAAPLLDADDYKSTLTYPAGSQVRDPDSGEFYQALQQTTGNAPTNTTYWGKLKSFDTYISKDQTGQTAVGTVLGVWDQNRRLTKGIGNPMQWEISNNGIQIKESAVIAWVEFRIRAPLLTGSKWSSTGTYASGNQAYYRSAAVPGNFYTANQATAAGESPETAAAKWDKVEIPLIFKSYLEHGAAADFLMPQGEEEAGPHRSLAEMMLADQAGVLLGQEEQTQRTVVLTR